MSRALRRLGRGGGIESLLGGKRGQLAWSALILLAACSLRVYRIDVVPPGLWYDEAFYGLDSLRSIKTGDLRVFYEANGGREPLLIWLDIVPISLLGATTLALHVVPVVFGIATVPVVGMLAKEMFWEEKRVHWLAIMASAGLATSYWHVSLSRIGFRAVLLPFFLALGSFFFWRAWRTGKYHLFGVAGVVIGLAAYTYLAARLLPLLFLGFILTEAIGEFHRHMCLRRHGTSGIGFSDRLKGFSITSLLAILVFLPAAQYFVSHPGAFSMRTADISLLSPAVHRGELPAALLSNVVAVARMFYDRGDMEWRVNLPGRPALDVFCAIGFSLGVVVSILRFRKGTYRFVLLWLVVMLLPTILSAQAPDTLRAIGALPAVYMLVAIGFVSTADFLEERIPRLSGAVCLPGLVVLLLGLSGFLTYRDYFTVWAQKGKTYRALDADKVALARHIAELGEGADIYLPLEMYAYPSILYLLDPYYPDVASNAVLAEGSPIGRRSRAVCLMSVDQAPEGAFVLLSREGDGRGVVYFMRPQNDEKLDELVDYAATRMADGRKVSDWRGRELAVEIPLESPSAFFSYDVTPTYPVGANFNDQAELLGFDLGSREAESNQVFRLTVYWRALDEVDTDYDVFVHLIDVGQAVWGQRDDQPLAGAYPTSLWRPGDVMPDLHEIPIGPGTPPGKYLFEVGLYQKSTSRRAPVLDPDLNPVDDKMLLGAVNVVDPSVAGQLPQHPVRLTLGTGIRLLGHSLDREEVRAGEAFHLTLYWEALRPIETDYAVFTHLVDSSERIWAQQDGVPQAGRNPTSLWYVGEVIRDQYTLLVESGAPPGEYYIEIGMYELSTGQRLPVMTMDGTRLGDRFLPGQVRVIG